MIWRQRTADGTAEKVEMAFDTVEPCSTYKIQIDNRNNQLWASVNGVVKTQSVEHFQNGFLIPDAAIPFHAPYMHDDGPDGKYLTEPLDAMIKGLRIVDAECDFFERRKCRLIC